MKRYWGSRRKTKEMPASDMTEQQTKRRPADVPRRPRARNPDARRELQELHDAIDVCDPPATQTRPVG